MYFAAVELRDGESPQDGVRHFIVVAADLGIRFRRLQVFGPFEFACHKFVRFRTDCPTFPPIIARLKSEGRGIIAPGMAGYRAFLPKGREGQVGLVLMQGTALPGQGKVYLGPQHPHWRTQFTGAGPAMAGDPCDPAGG